jgi:hemerythrin-like domain-containing protein
MDTARPRAGPDAIRLLMADHQEIDACFERHRRRREFADAGEDTYELRHSLALQICTMLVVHAAIEEDLFDPAARGVLDDQFVIDEAAVEHASVKELIRQVRASNPGEPLYEARIEVLARYVRHHVREEENQLFPRVRRTAPDLFSLGRRMRDRGQALMVEATLPEQGELPA